MENNILKLIRNYTINDKIEFKKHSYTRMFERSISSNDIKRALKNCTIIKSYKKDKPLPSYLVLGYIDSNDPLHIVLSLDVKQEILWIITVYKPDESLWDSEYKRRKK